MSTRKAGCHIKRGGDHIDDSDAAILRALQDYNLDENLIISRKYDSKAYPDSGHLPALQKM
jgi:hypothetical protein